MLFLDYVRWVMEDANYLKIRLGFYYEISPLPSWCHEKTGSGAGSKRLHLKTGPGNMGQGQFQISSN